MRISDPLFVQNYMNNACATMVLRPNRRNIVPQYRALKFKCTTLSAEMVQRVYAGMLSVRMQR